MKINEKESTLVKSNLENSRQFKVGNEAGLVNIVRNKMYSNPKNTLVQEYLSNARDANRDAKSKRPIEVSLPNELSPILKIRDFGPGLSDSAMYDVFIQYCVSTKTDNDAMTGGYGVGGKSYFAYGDSFTIHSTQNGVKNSYIAHVSKNSIGDLDQINKIETSEPNGLEIELPVKKEDIDAFITAVYKTTFMWGDERPLITGILPSEIPTWWSTVDLMHWPLNPQIPFEGPRFKICHFPENFKSSETYRSKDRFVYVFVDGIPYKPLASSGMRESLFNYFKLSNLSKDTGICVFTKTGEVEIPANREEISDNPNNMNFLKELTEQIISDFKNNIPENLQKIPISNMLQSIERLSNVVSGLDTSFSLNDLSVKVDSKTSIWPKIEINHPDLAFSLRRIRRDKTAKKVLEEENPQTKPGLNLLGLDSHFLIINDIKKDHEKLFHRLSTSSKIALKKQSAKDLIIVEDTPFVRDFFTTPILASSVFEKKTKDPTKVAELKADNSIIYYSLIKSQARYFSLLKQSKSLDKSKIKNLEKAVVVTLGKNNSLNNDSDSNFLKNAEILLTFGFNLIGVSEKSKGLFSMHKSYESVKDDLANILNLKDETTLKELKVNLLSKTSWYPKIFQKTINSTLLEYLKNPMIDEMKSLRSSGSKIGNIIKDIYTEEEQQKVLEDLDQKYKNFVDEFLELNPFIEFIQPSLPSRYDWEPANGPSAVKRTTYIKNLEAFIQSHIKFPKEGKKSKKTL